MDPVDIVRIRPVQTASDSQIVVLLNGSFLTRTCKPASDCVNDCMSARGSVEIPGFRKTIEEAGRPKYRAAMSRASGWNDAVVGLASGGRIDLADVFRGTRARPIRFRLCSTEPSSACDDTYLTANWDGQTASVVSNAFTPGLFRIIEDDGISDAWIRVIENDRAAEAQAEYRAAIDALKSWRLPDGEASLPTIDRLRRPILASIGGAQ